MRNRLTAITAAVATTAVLALAGCSHHKPNPSPSTTAPTATVKPTSPAPTRTTVRPTATNPTTMPPTTTATPPTVTPTSTAGSLAGTTG